MKNHKVEFIVSVEVKDNGDVVGFQMRERAPERHDIDIAFRAFGALFKVLNRANMDLLKVD